MAVAIADVPMWLILRGQIGHALAQTNSRWHYTICGTITPNGHETKLTPTKICRQCRVRLREISLTSQHETK